MTNWHEFAGFCVVILLQLGLGVLMLWVRQEQGRPGESRRFARVQWDFPSAPPISAEISAPPKDSGPE